jgi:hypothetical protein
MSPKHPRKPGKGRIMVQVWGQVAAAITRDFTALHLKRNGYLNDLFSLEIEELATEIQTPNPEGFYERLVSRKLPNRVKWTLELDEELIKRMDKVLTDRRIPRDAFVNRILFFLVAKKPWLDQLGVAYERKGEVTAKPLEDVRGFLQDPFFHIRSANDGRFYGLCWFPDRPLFKNVPNLFSLNVAMTEGEWADLNDDTDIFAELGLIPAGSPSHAD